MCVCVWRLFVPVSSPPSLWQIENFHFIKCWQRRALIVCFPEARMVALTVANTALCPFLFLSISLSLSLPYLCLCIKKNDGNFLLETLRSFRSLNKNCLPHFTISMAVCCAKGAGCPATITKLTSATKLC